MPIGVILKSSNTGYAGRVRRAAMRTKCSRVVVVSGKETLIVMSRKHSGRWLDDFARNERATIITRNAEIPADTYPAACGLEMMSSTSRLKHQNQCQRCDNILAPGDIRAEVQAEVTEVARAGNTQNLYEPVTSSRAEEPAPEETAPVEALVAEYKRLEAEPAPVAEPTLPVLIDEMRGIADRALNLAGEVETAVAALNRLSEIRLEMHGLVEEYERLKEEAAKIK
jgi:hypothetical protein